jgi:hypothetical protein
LGDLRTVANQDTCEALCSNNVRCELYESREASREECFLFTFARGVLLLDDLDAELNTLARPCAGCISASTIP